MTTENFDLQDDIDQAQTAYQHYLKTNDLKDLEKSIVVWEQILNHSDFATADEQLRLGILNNSSITFMRRYQTMGKCQDLDTALSCWQQVITTLSPDSPNFPMLLNNLGNGLRDRYTRTGEIKDLQAAIEAFQKTVHLTSDNSPDLHRRY